MVNKIEVVEVKHHSGDGWHYEIAVDGVLLDQLLHSKYPDRHLLKMVPVLLDWLTDSKEIKVVWERIIPQDALPVISPILMCSDDRDFWCTIVVAEAVRKEDSIHWTRIGIDRTPNKHLHPELVGQEVEWLDGIGPFIFDLKNFMEMVATFK